MVETLKVAEIFTKASGTDVNKQKSQILLSGGLKNEIMDTFEGITTRTDMIHILGAWVGNNQEIHKRNWDPVINKMQKVINLWKGRNLSMCGKIVITKTFLLSKLWYLIQYETISKELITAVNKIIWNFIWSDKNPTIERKMCCMNKNIGGIGCIDLETEIKSIQLKWIFKLLLGTAAPWSFRAREYINQYHNKIKTTNLEILYLNLRTVRNCKIPKFYLNIVNFFKELDLKKNEIKTREQI